jgi:hypothetical protein
MISLLPPLFGFGKGGYALKSGSLFVFNQMFIFSYKKSCKIIITNIESFNIFFI